MTSSTLEQPQAEVETPHRGTARPRRRRTRVELLREHLEQVRAAYLAAWDEVKALRESGAPVEQWRAASTRAVALHEPVAAARRALSEAERRAAKRCRA